MTEKSVNWEERADRHAIWTLAAHKHRYVSVCSIRVSFHYLLLCIVQQALGAPSTFEVAQLQQQLAAALQEVRAAREEAASSTAAAARHEADLRDLSTAYNALEGHSFGLEGQLREAQAKLAAVGLPAESGAAIGSAGLPGPGWVSETDVVAREGAAREAAEREAEEQLTDLLVCLGQEEAKVGTLSVRLAEFGVDVDALLNSIATGNGGAVDELL
eukprot:364928-Chlamydomonas_euryale.AAC.3